MDTTTEIGAFKVHLENTLKPDWHVVTSELENMSSNGLILIVEPWGTDVTILPGEKYEIVGAEPKGFGLNVTVSDRYIQVWAGDLIEVFQNGIGHGITGEYLEWRRRWQEERA